MYSLYLSNKLQNGEIEETLIFSSNVPSETLALISPSIDVESGTAGSCDFTMPPSNVGYNLVELMRTEVIFKINEEEKWRGRVLNTDSDFYNQMKVECEGELAYLNDTYQPQKEYDNATLRQFLETVISIHNKKVTDANGNPVGPIDKRFTVGAVYVEDVVGATVDEMFRKTDYDTTMSCLRSVANTYKGYFLVRWSVDDVTGVRTRKLDFVKNFVDTCSQTIDFGQNLLDFNKSYNMQDLCTVAMPIGAKMEDKAGDEITLYDTENDQPINYLGSDGRFGYDSGDTYRYARVCYLNTGEFQTGDKIYASVAQTEDTMSPVSKDGIWCFAASDGSPIEGTVKKWSGTPGSMEVETYEKYELTIPAGAHRFRIGGNVHYQPEIKVYRQKAKERVDECYTIESVPSYGGDGDESNPVKHTEGDIYIIHKALFEKYGWHEKKLTFGDLDNGQKLNDLAVEYLTTTQFEQMTLDITAIDLSNLNANYEKIWINMNVPIYSKPHGLDYGQLTLPCTKIKIRLDAPEDSNYTLGYSSSDKISDTQTNVAADLSGIMDEIPAMSTALQAAKNNATELLEAFADAGVVEFVRNENNPNEITQIRINTTGTTKPSRWIWNSGGLGFEEYDPNDGWVAVTAMTRDGGIVGDRVVAASMHADRIRGGILQLGTQNVDGDSTPGTIELYNGTPRTDKKNRLMAMEKDYGFTNEDHVWREEHQGQGDYAWGGTYMRIRGTSIYGGFIDADNTSSNNRISEFGEPCAGRINFKQGYIPAGSSTPLYGVDIRGDIIGLNSFDIWVSRGLDGPAVPTLTDTVTVGDVTFDIVKGLIVGYTRNQNQGE